MADSTKGNNKVMAAFPCFVSPCVGQTYLGQWSACLRRCHKSHIGPSLLKWQAGCREASDSHTGRYLGYLYLKHNQRSLLSYSCKPHNLTFSQCIIKTENHLVILRVENALANHAGSYGFAGLVAVQPRPNSDRSCRSGASEHAAGTSSLTASAHSLL